MPIASKILGHRRLTSTEPYVAVFQDDPDPAPAATFVDNRRTGRPPPGVPRTHRRRMGRVRRTLHPAPGRTGQACARPTSSRCEHEHACLRCPYSSRPAQLDRLAC